MNDRKPDASPVRHLQVHSADHVSSQIPHHGGRSFLRFIDFVESLPSALHYAIAAGLIVVVFIGDVVTGFELALSIFYLMPISMLAWHRGWKAALLAVLACGVAWVSADIMTDHTYSHPAIQYWNALVRLGFFLIVAGILTQLRHSVVQQQRLARTDSLTGVVNSRWFLEVATAEIARQKRYGHPLSIAFLDCDNFKQVNDRFGHAAGDDLLKCIGECMEETLRSVDTVARLGGDEFALLMPETGATAAGLVCDKVREALTRAVWKYDVTFSIGLVTYLEPPTDVKEMVHSADEAMYEAKKTGKNSWRHRVIGQPLANGTNP